MIISTNNKLGIYGSTEDVLKYVLPQQNTLIHFDLQIKELMFPYLFNQHFYMLEWFQSLLGSSYDEKVGKRGKRKEYNMTKEIKGRKKYF